MLIERHWFCERISYVVICMNFLKDNFTFWNYFTNVVIFLLKCLAPFKILGSLAIANIASIDASATAMYSSSIEDIEVVLCLASPVYGSTIKYEHISRFGFCIVLARYWRFIEKVITKTIDYHLFDVVVEFHRIIFCIMLHGGYFEYWKAGLVVVTASIDASAATMYPASVEDIAVVLCLALFQSTAPPLSMNTYPVWDLVSSLSVHAVRCTRPDVAFAQNLCSRFQQNPGEIHWTAVKNILKYIRNTKDMVLVYGAKPKVEMKVSCYADASFQTDKDDTKSQTGYVFILNGGAVDWKSAKQSTTAMSSTEAGFQQNPGEIHWTAVKNILKYLRNTKDMVLMYGAKPKVEMKVSCYTDASFQTDKDDTKSQTGYVFILNGGAVDWKSAKQSTTAMSSTEAGYIVAAEASMEAV
nr:retrotransposon protein, putative, Ty1-copia subclass [Tanacetum cinerariifolium]